VGVTATGGNKSRSNQLAMAKKVKWTATAISSKKGGNNHSTGTTTALQKIIQIQQSTGGSNTPAETKA